MSAVLDLLQKRGYRYGFRHFVSAGSSLAFGAGTGGTLQVNSGGASVPNPGTNEALRIVRAQLFVQTSVAAGVGAGLIVDWCSMQLSAILPGPLFLALFGKGFPGNQTPSQGPNIPRVFNFIGEETSEIYFGDQGLGALTSSTESGLVLTWAVDARNGGAGAITLTTNLIAEVEVWRTEGPLTIR